MNEKREKIDASAAGTCGDLVCEAATILSGPLPTGEPERSREVALRVERAAKMLTDPSERREP